MKGRPLPSKSHKSCTVIIGEDDRHLLSVIETKEGGIIISGLRPTTHKHFDKGKILLPSAKSQPGRRGTLWTLTAMSSRGKQALLMALKRLDELPMGQQDVLRLSEVELDENKTYLFTKVIEPDRPMDTQ